MLLSFHKGYFSGNFLFVNIRRNILFLSLPFSLNYEPISKTTMTVIQFSFERVRWMLSFLLIVMTIVSSQRMEI